MLADHDRIHNERKRESKRGRGDGFHDRAIAQRPRLRRLRRNVVKYGVQLVEDPLRSQALYAIDALRILDREHCEDSLAVDAELVEGFEISLDASPATGIR